MSICWKTELKHSVRSLDELKNYFPTLRITPQMRRAADRFPMCISPHYLSLIREPDFSDPIFAQCVPNGDELVQPEWLSDDPLGELACQITSRLVRRYSDRALLLVSSACASYCRHCTRKRVASCKDSFISDSELSQAVDALRSLPEVSDLLVSGGDPLLMDDKYLARVLDAICEVPSIKVVRICTRVPVALPCRITPALVKVLSKRPFAIYCNTHFNHPNEVCDASLRACAMLTNAGIPVGSQTVLLRGVNDSADVLETLFRALFHNRIRPYCLFQCDLSSGVEHFRTSIDAGLEIMKTLRERLSGLAIPNYCIDPPGHGGKIELTPDYIVRRSLAGIVLRDGAGREFLYPSIVNCNNRTSVADSNEI